MNDLAGLDWGPSSSQSASKPLPMSNGNYYPPLRPTPPISGRSTPAHISSSAPKPSSSSNVPSKASTPANDSFANLVPYSKPQLASTLTLQEQQRILQEQRAKLEHDRQRQLEKHFGPVKENTWAQLGDGRATPNRVVSPPTYTGTDEYGGQKLSAAINRPFSTLGKSSTSSSSKNVLTPDEDLLAAFDADTPVDCSSDFPVSADTYANDTVRPRAPNSVYPTSYSSEITETTADDDDDPFGLGTMAPSKIIRPFSPTAPDDEDDVLGLLGRPISELPPPQSQSPEMRPGSPAMSAAPLDRAAAELVDMGFPADRSRTALGATESGVDVQAAVGWLLNQAHEESRLKSGNQQTRGRDTGGYRAQSVPRKASIANAEDVGAAMPTWLRQQSRSNSTQRREDSRSPAFGEKDPAKVAAEIGSNLFKTANSLWKTGTKKLNQAVSEFNSDSESSQPKWMRETTEGRQNPTSSQGKRRQDSDKDKLPPQRIDPRPSPKITPPNMTDEALMLESGSARPQPRRKEEKSIRSEPRVSESGDSSRDHSPSMSTRHDSTAQARFFQQPPPGQAKSKLSRQAIEDENAQAYISPARRKKGTPKPPSPEPDLLFESSQQSALPVRVSQSRPTPKGQASPLPLVSILSRPAPKKRSIPPLSSIAFQSSTSHRQAGTSAFKLGNYAEAMISYTTSLSVLPSSHPLTVVLLTNRALTHLKIGDPKASIADADTALAIIGSSRGQGEMIDIGGDEGSKEMGLYWGKAMTRKAEALEQLERWVDAAKAWKACVEAGVGGSTSIAGRDRCDRAAGSSSSQPITARPAARPPSTARKPSNVAPYRSALDDLSGRPTPSKAPSAEAVTRLRAANAEAERVDDEKFALADSVDERLSTWRRGKEGNLRALLGSLDTVLWEGAGWKKVGMSELIVPAKVKVAYMRGIGKVHPDKVSNFH